MPNKMTVEIPSTLKTPRGCINTDGRETKVSRLWEALAPWRPQLVEHLAEQVAAINRIAERRPHSADQLTAAARQWAEDAVQAAYDNQPEPPRDTLLRAWAELAEAGTIADQWATAHRRHTLALGSELADMGDRITDEIKAELTPALEDAARAVAELDSYRDSVDTIAHRDGGRLDRALEACASVTWLQGIRRNLGQLDGYAIAVPDDKLLIFRRPDRLGVERAATDPLHRARQRVKAWANAEAWCPTRAEITAHLDAWREIAAARQMPRGIVGASGW